MAIPSFSETHVDQRAEVLANAVSHRQLTAVFQQLHMVEPVPLDGVVGGKQKRIVRTLVGRQRQDRCGNNVGRFIEVVLDPALFADRSADFGDFRNRANVILAFSGLQVSLSGKLEQATPARTLSEAEERAGKLRSELSRRRVHPDVLRFCRPELLEKNYFHAVLEATKSVAEKIRERTGLTIDGGELVDKAFGGSSPLLAINTLRTESELSEQRGFANLLRGTFGTFRNPTAHAAKISWPINEQDALDLLTLVSYLHRRLDAAVLVPRVPEP